MSKNNFSISVSKVESVDVTSTSDNWKIKLPPNGVSFRVSKRAIGPTFGQDHYLLASYKDLKELSELLQATLKEFDENKIS